MGEIPQWLAGFAVGWMLMDIVLAGLKFLLGISRR